MKLLVLMDKSLTGVKIIEYENGYCLEYIQRHKGKCKDAQAIQTSFPNWQDSVTPSMYDGNFHLPFAVQTQKKLESAFQ